MTTITRRVVGTIADGVSKRVSGIIAESSTQRVTGAITEDSSLRVPTNGATPAIGPFIGTDTWGRTWGNTWGRTWFFGTLVIPAIPASPVIDVTARVSGAAAGGHTKRVTM